MGKFLESPFFKVFKRELRLISKGRNQRFMLFWGPLIGFTLLAWIFSPGVPRKLPIAVLDYDHSELSRQIRRMVDATPIAKVQTRFEDLGSAEKAMQDGTINAILCIPEGSEKKILKGLSEKLPYYINQSNILKGGLLNSGVRRAIMTFSTGLEIQTLLSKGNLTEQQAISKAEPINLKSVLLFNPFSSYAYYLTLAFIPLMLILFVMLSTTFSLGNELYKGTGPEWINKTAGGNFPSALAGKLFPYTILYMAQACIMNLIFFRLLKVPINGNPIAIYMAEILLIVCYQCMSVFLLAITESMRLSMSLACGYSMLAASYCGMTFPVFGMSTFSQVAAAIFPFKYWGEILVGQSLRGEPISNTLLPNLSFAFFICFAMLFLPRIKHMMLNEKSWGKL